MLKKTDEEIKTFFNNLLDGPDSIEVNSNEKEVRVKVSQSYEFVPNGFKELSAIGEFFETDKVNGSDKDYYKGCETCDYGSSYEVTFVIEE